MQFPSPKGREKSFLNWAHRNILHDRLSEAPKQGEEGRVETVVELDPEFGASPKLEPRGPFLRPRCSARLRFRP